MSIPTLPAAALTFEDYPSTSTPLSAAALNPWGTSVYDLASAARAYALAAEAAATAATAPTDSMIANALNTPGSDSRAAADNLYGAIVGVDSNRYLTPDGGTDQSTELQAALDAAAAASTYGATALVLRPGEYIIGTPCDVAAGVRVRGLPGAVLIAAGDNYIFEATSATTFEHLTFQGTNTVGGTATLTGQYAINAVGAGGARLSDVTVTGCRFEGFEYAAVRIRHTDRFRVTDNAFFDTGYSAVQVSCAADGVISGNFFRGTGVLPSYAVNSYAVSMSLESSAIDPVTNPPCTRIAVAHNTVINQAWEALDTHGGTEIAFTGNVIVGCESGIAAVIKSGVTSSSPQHVAITGNVIDGGDFSTTNKRFGIAVNGESSGPTYARAVITGNSISNMGISQDHPAQWSPAGASVMVTNAAAVVVSNNLLCNSLGHGVSLKNVAAGTVSGNMIDGVWRETGDTSRYSSAVYLLDHTGLASITGNTLVGGSGLTNPNERAIQQAGTGVGTVRDLDNYWGTSPNENVSGGWTALAAPSGFTSAGVWRIKGNEFQAIIDLTPTSAYAGGTLTDVVPANPLYAQTGSNDMRQLVWQTATPGPLTARVFTTGQVNVYLVPALTTSQRVYGTVKWSIA